jgi:hypothetical protein
MSVIDSNALERNFSGKAAQRSTFPHPARDPLSILARLALTRIGRRR